jgi:type I restriction enzyme S subunit
MINVYLKQICYVKAGNGFPEKLQGQKKGVYPFYKVKDISEAFLNNKIYLRKANHYLDAKQVKQINGTIMPPNSISFAKIGEALKLNRRAILTVDSLVDNNVVCVVPDERLADHKYLFYFLTTIKLGNLSRSTTVPSVRKTDVEDICIPFCHLPEQKRIVAKIESLFSRLDSAKDSLVCVRAEIKRYRQSVLKAAFKGGLIGSTGISEEVELKDMILESMIGLVRSNNKQNHLNIGVPYIKMNNIDMDGNLNLENIVFVKANHDEVTRYSLRKGDLLVNTRNSYELVGKSAVVREDNVVRVYNNNIVRLRFKKGFNPYFVGFQMIAPRVQKEMKLGKKATTNICALYHKDLFSLKFKIYSYEQQARVVSAIESRFERTKVLEDAVEQGLERIDQLKQSILKKAFEGKLVASDLNDESVEVLLERIKKEKTKLNKSNNKEEKAR